MRRSGSDQNVRAFCFGQSDFVGAQLDQHAIIWRSFHYPSVVQSGHFLQIRGNHKILSCISISALAWAVRCLGACRDSVVEAAAQDTGRTVQVGLRP